MRYRPLGSSGLQVSELGLGANNFGGRLAEQADSTRVIHAALDAGVNLIDTADDYGKGLSEEFVGAAVRDRRDSVVVATKFNLHHRGDTPIEAFIMGSAEASLRRLGTHIDLYQIHWPVKDLPDEAYLEPLGRLVERGDVRFAGECNFAAWRHASANRRAAAQGLPEMVSAQHNYNLFNRTVELEVLPFCAEASVGFLPYYPLAAGLLTGKYTPGAPPPENSRGSRGHGELTRLRGRERNESLLAPLTGYARAHGHGLLELAFGWMLARPEVTSVIAGAMSPEQVASNVAAVEAWRMSDEEHTAIDDIAGWDPAVLLPEREAL